MTDNPIHIKFFSRGESGQLEIGRSKRLVKYTSEWQPVVGGQGVTCRTWEVEGIDADVDGADIKIDKGGFTPIQLVKAANYVVDALELGKGYCCVMTPGGKINTNYFDGSENKQMVWEKGMVIVWVAKEQIVLTEYENPAFNEEMFINIPDEQVTIQGYTNEQVKKFKDEVDRLKKQVNIKEIHSTLSKFLDFAHRNRWQECDAMILDICDNPIYQIWGKIDGFIDERVDARDMAISIFEQTKRKKLTEIEISGLRKILIDDENLHLRRKAAFALFKFGDRSQEVIDRIKDAAANDEELKVAANNYLL